MGIVAILSFFLVMMTAVLIDGGFASGALGISALLVSLGVAIVGLVVVMKILPETKGRSLEELEQILVKG